MGHEGLCVSPDVERVQAFTHQLGAFDESGELRALYPTDRDRFFTGPGAAVASSIESRVEFQRDARGRIASLTWHRESAPPRTARRADVEKHEDVRFPSGGIQLAGTVDHAYHRHATPRNHPRAWFRPPESGVHPSVRPVSGPSRHGGPRLRQAGGRRLERGLECGLARRPGRRRSRRVRVSENPSATSTGRRLACSASARLVRSCRLQPCARRTWPF